MKNKLAAITFVVSIALGTVANAASISDSHIEAARNLMIVTNSEKMFDQILPPILTQQIEATKRINPKISTKELNRFKEIFINKVNESKKELIENIAQLYAKNLDEKTIRSVVEFYKTEAGRKLIETQPTIIKQSFAIGLRWGQTVGVKAAQETKEQLKKEGF